MKNVFRELNHTGASFGRNFLPDPEGEDIMPEEINEIFKHISSQRYIVEIQDNDTGKVYYTKRIGTIKRAINMAAEYNEMKGMSALIIDTKSGEYV